MDCRLYKILVLFFICTLVSLLTLSLSLTHIAHLQNSISVPNLCEWERFYTCQFFCPPHQALHARAHERTHSIKEHIRMQHKTRDLRMRSRRFYSRRTSVLAVELIPKIIFNFSFLLCLKMFGQAAKEKVSERKTVQRDSGRDWVMQESRQ